jgi:methyl-accepting chemotaxis protein PixJ
MQPSRPAAADSNRSSLSPKATTTSQPSTGAWIGLRNRLGKNLLPSLGIAAAISAGLVGVSAWKTWSVYQQFQQAVTLNFQLQKLSDRSVYLDEVLTMSARMLATTGDPKWEIRYNKFVTELDQVTKDLQHLAPEYTKAAAEFSSINDKLVALEVQSFELVHKGNPKAALTLLLGPEYEPNKNTYSQNIENILKQIQGSVNTQVKLYSQELAGSALLAAASFPLLVVSWTLVLSLVASYIRERNEAQLSLLTLNEELENRVQVRTQQLAQQEQATRLESEVLQADVGLILDAVSAVEGGDLTTQAPVSDRVTGLVADTFNRLIEELARVMGQVWQASHQVSAGAHQLEKMAATVAGNSTQQATSVGQVLSLTEIVEQSAQQSARQVLNSIAAFQKVDQVAEDGQEAIAALNQGIEILQQGTDQIIQQMKTLGEFVGLTDQFLQEQNQIASMTQVLAMNASLVAARGSEQRDPTQFVVVAREFEAIATQVSNLAQRTSTGLVSLEQRSNQIHNVVASVDANVQNLGSLVRDFNEGVAQSRQAFGNVQLASQEAVNTGSSLTQASQRIVESAQATAQLMRDIAAFAAQTAHLTQQSRQQSGQMGALSSRLLDTVQFFQLPQTALAAAIATEAIAANPTKTTSPRTPDPITIANTFPSDLSNTNTRPDLAIQPILEDEVDSAEDLFGALMQTSMTTTS